jgi:DMSO reductase anchor subunit
MPLRWHKWQIFIEKNPGSIDLFCKESVYDRDFVVAWSNETTENVHFCWVKILKSDSISSVLQLDFLKNIW